MVFLFVKYFVEFIIKSIEQIFRFRHEKMKQ